MIEYQFEKVDDVLEEIEPLLEEHYAETVPYPDRVVLNPNYDMYRLLEQADALVIYTARDLGAIVGYAITVLQPHPHSQGHTYAANDMIYICPEYRHTELAPEMLKNLEEHLKERGVSVMTFHMKAIKPCETLMSGLGYQNDEVLYTKYIQDE